MKTCKFKYTVAIFFLIAPLLFLSCGGHYGRISKDGEINKSFLNGTVLPNYNYYYSGPEGLPTAILRIKKEYELVSDQWVAFDPSEKLLKKWVGAIRFYYNDLVRPYPYGYEIVYCNGETIGGWYSIWDWTAVKCLEDKKVNVYPPPLDEPFPEGDENDKVD